MLSDRSSQILEAVVREFIRSGEPVSSERLFERYDFGIRPAMIRLELESLEGGGFLEQPYHSAGRIPSDTAYEFFARHILSLAEPSAAGGILENLCRPHHFQEFLSDFSDRLNLLCAGAEHSSGASAKFGLDNLVNALDWQAAEEIRGVIRDFEELDSRIFSMEKILDEAVSPAVFVGRRSPVTKSPFLSVVAGTYNLNGSRLTVVAIGPKRMDYEKTIKTFKKLKGANKKRKTSVK